MINTTLLFALLLAGFMGCTGPSSRERTMDEARKLREQGFTLSAAQAEKEAKTLSDASEFEFSLGGGSKDVVINGTYYGNEELGYANIPATPISVQEAIRLAGPYLDSSMRIRKEIFDAGEGQKPIIQVTLSGSSFHVIRDIYPSKVSGILRAVRVDINSGKVFPPK